MSTWHSLVGTFGSAAGASGTVTLPDGACLLMLSVHASADGATFSVLGGPSVPVINAAATLVYEFQHLLQQAKGATKTIVFAGTDHYYVHYIVLKH